MRPVTLIGVDADRRLTPHRPWAQSGTHADLAGKPPVCSESNVTGTTPEELLAEIQSMVQQLIIDKMKTPVAWIVEQIVSNHRIPDSPNADIHRVYTREGIRKDVRAELKKVVDKPGGSDDTQLVLPGSRAYRRRISSIVTASHTWSPWTDSPTTRSKRKRNYTKRWRRGASSMRQSCAAIARTDARPLDPSPDRVVPSPVWVTLRTSPIASAKCAHSVAAWWRGSWWLRWSPSCSRSRTRTGGSRAVDRARRATRRRRVVRARWTGRALPAADVRRRNRLLRATRRSSRGQVRFMRTSVRRR